ncbi:MAG: NfeD family protein, partial [Planctomycetota bacterium]
LAVAMPFIVSSAIKHWPHTPMGRRILNVDPDGYDESLVNPFAELVDKQGIAVTKMLPSGSVRIQGTLYDAVSDGQAIEIDQPIQVVDVDGNRILVRPIAELTDVEPGSQDPLSRPASEVFGDAFEDPLT